MFFVVNGSNIEIKKQQQSSMFHIRGSLRFSVASHISKMYYFSFQFQRKLTLLQIVSLTYRIKTGF